MAAAVQTTASVDPLLACLCQPPHIAEQASVPSAPHINLFIVDIYA
jgi:hypothetical protein